MREDVEKLRIFRPPEIYPVGGAWGIRRDAEVGGGREVAMEEINLILQVESGWVCLGVDDMG